MQYDAPAPGRPRIADHDGQAARRVLDASAFYTGLPFESLEAHHTTQAVLDEVRHIKSNYDVLGALIQTGRLTVRDPLPEHVAKIRDAAAASGDMRLSDGDVSVLALCLEMRGELVTDDFAVSNVASNLGLRVSPIMTPGIRTAGRWIHYCPGCEMDFPGDSVCPQCGNALRRRLAGNQAS